MSNLLKNNSYHILGLNASASQRDIQKRAKEIIKVLQIDDVPEYDLDLGIFENFRTVGAVKDAVQKLTSPKKQIKDYFFWFQISDEVDEQAVGILRKKNPEGAIRVWEHSAEGDSTKAMFYKKNLALLYCILLFNEDNKQYLKKSLQIWHEIINSPKFWTAFTMVYKHNDELDTDQEIISDFHILAPSFLADLYVELRLERGDDSYVAEFTKVFNLRGEKTEKVVMTPIFHKMNDAIEKLEAMKVSEDGKLDKEEATQIKQHVTNIQDCCNTLIDLGLYGDSQSKTMRDRAATAIRSISLDIHNNLDDVPKAEQLLNIAMQFVGTSSMENKLKQDLVQFEKNKKILNALEPITALMNDKKFDEAITLIDQKKTESKDPEFEVAMDNKKKEALTMYATIEFIGAKKLFDAENYDGASPLLQKAASIVYNNIEIFDVDKSVIDSWLELIKGNTKVLTAENATEVQEIHNKMLKKIDEVFNEQFEQMAIKILVNSYYYVGISEVIKKKKSSDVVSKIIQWAVTIGILWLISAIFG